MPLLQPENRFPDLVFLKLNGISSIKSNIRQIAMTMTLRFGEQCLVTPAGKVRFGLKRGELKLKLIDGTMALEHMGLTTPFTIEIGVEEQKEEGGETEINIATSGGMKARSIKKAGIKTTHKTYQCHTGGTEKDPIWIFHAETENPPILLGQLTEESLGTVKPAKIPCQIKATFEVSGQSALYLIESEGILWAKDLERNKTAPLAILFFKQFIQPKLKPYLSQIEGSV